MSDAVAVAAGGGHSLVLKSDGTVWSFGINYLGVLGTSLTLSTSFKPIQVMSDASAIAAGSAHSLVIKKDGTVWPPERPSSLPSNLAAARTGEHHSESGSNAVAVLHT